MSIALGKVNIINLIRKNMDIFSVYDNVYIFGSILEEDRHSNDIDILVLYSGDFYDVIKRTNEVTEYIEKLISYPVDITVLSVEEEKDVGFIDRLNGKYIRIK
jgi:uncharacterized protein